MTLDKLYDISYSLFMKCTSDFLSWFRKLDRSLQLRLDQRLQRLADGNPGFHKRFDSLIELKWKTGTMGSFRVYLAEYSGVLLLLGGHKDKQSKDIESAKILLEGVKSGNVRIKEYE